ncbi:HTH-type transcriptional repressor ComR [Pleomorphomonas sp. T1.2MG-36]|uniref:TetR/AcrR family transcriptional regulator n=1 Tax=Pleomorphomonas sp. T1.2MG-36 TaxID=3041167 RepID=UPI0024773052|nr:TetR/AcrR family transcriptional regulator [Pleomorphomonas sp. T1.2MG-36]CAI9417153.1 HTH-type transcriptional repressor ComR [Pleomorphomonas sp. T1.2MG-36]
MIVVKNGEPSSRRGRPRSFDRDAALAKAVETFWRHGYEGTSIADLTGAMGITAQSLYAAFSSKADLYREALSWYQTHVGSLGADLGEESDVVAEMAALLAGSAHAFTRPGRPRGCMISTSVLTCAVENEPIARHVQALRGASIDRLRARIERGIAEGQLKPTTDSQALARFIGAMIQGMSVQAQDGASEATLLTIVDHAVAEIARHRA